MHDTHTEMNDGAKRASLSFRLRLFGKERFLGTVAPVWFRHDDARHDCACVKFFGWESSIRVEHHQQTARRSREWEIGIEQSTEMKSAKTQGKSKRNEQIESQTNRDGRIVGRTIYLSQSKRCEIKKIKLYVKRQKRIKLQRTEQPMPFASYVLSTKAVYSRMERRCSQSNTANTANCTSNRRERLTCYSTTIFTQ